MALLELAPYAAVLSIGVGHKNGDAAGMADLMNELNISMILSCVLLFLLLA